MSYFTFEQEMENAMTGDKPQRSPWDAARVLELQKAHKALLRKNRQIETLRDRVRALENTVRMVNEDYENVCFRLESLEK